MFGTFAVLAQKEETVKVGYENAVAVPDSDIKIIFVSVTEDSRCPTDVNCIWAGRAVVKVTISKKGSESSVIFSTNGDDQIKKLYGYKFELVGLEPYPSGNGTIKEEDYVAEFKIEPAK